MIKYLAKLSAAFLVVCSLFAFSLASTQTAECSVANALGRTYEDEVPIGATKDIIRYISSPVKAVTDGNHYTGRHIEAQIPTGYYKMRIINVVGSNGHSSTYIELGRNIKHPEFRELSKTTYLVRVPDLAFSSRILTLTIKEM